MKPGRDPAGVPMQLRCGQCIGCKVSRSQDWAVRCCNEKLFHEQSVFLTLTWDSRERPLVLPRTAKEFHRPWQLFAKRVRKRKGPFRFFMCGEYGEDFGRPHYHAIVFGIGFSDRKLFKTNPMTLWRSAELEELWPHGYSSFGEVTMESAQYVAGYVTAPRPVEDDEWWEGPHVRMTSDGELVQVAPEYGRMSLKPGIGARYFEKYHKEVTVRDACVVNGREFKPPKYYDRLLRGYASVDRERGTATVRRGIDRSRYDAILEDRLEVADEVMADSKPSRLRVAEKCVKSRMALKRRVLE